MYASSVEGVRVREAMIASRVLVPHDQRERTSRIAVAVDAETFTAVAREIVNSYGRERAHALALDSDTDPRVASALSALLGTAS